MKRSLLAVVGALLVAAPAGAHVGAVVSKAVFDHPAPPTMPGTDMGATAWAYVPEDADASYRVSWQDGDVDPTAKFTFYWIDHDVPTAVTADDVESLGTVLRTTDGVDARDIYASCTCTDNIAAGIVCPDMAGEMRWCDNDFVWDTSQLADGTYWIFAVNNDPPYHVYNESLEPVRVHHGQDPVPPVVIVVKPDGISVADASMHVGVLVAATAPATVDLAYGENLMGKVLGPVASMAKGLAATAGADGLVGYDWDTATLADAPYFVRAVVHDASGATSTSDSRYGGAVYHHKDMAGTALDQGARDANLQLVAPPAPSGCGCRAGSRPTRSPWPVAALVLCIAAISRRRGRRRGSRSGCTG